MRHYTNSEVAPYMHKFAVTPEGYMILASFSANSEYLITLHGVKDVYIWETFSGKLVQTLQFTSPHEDQILGKRHGFNLYVEAVALNRDGNLALIGFNDGTAGLFSVKTGEKLLSLGLLDSEPLESKYGLVRAVSFAANDTLLLIGFHNRNVGVWDIASSKWIVFFQTHHPLRSYSPQGLGLCARHISLSLDGCYLFAVYINTTAVIWDMQAAKLVLEAYDHSDAILDIVINQDKLTAITKDGNIWQISNGELDFSINTHRIFSNATWASNGLNFIASSKNEIQYGTITGDIISLAVPEEPPSWDEVSIINSTGEVFFYRLAETEYACSASGKLINFHSEKKMSGCLLSPSEQIVAVFSRELIEFWNIVEAKLMGKLEVGGYIHSACFLHSSKFLAFKKYRVVAQH